MAIRATVVELKLQEAIRYVFSHLNAHWNGKKVATPFICGKPGGGKSEMMSYACAQKGIGFLPITVGLIRVERFTGIPDFREVQYKGNTELNTIWSVPEIVGTLRVMSEKFERVICLYDDWHIAPPEVQASGFETFTYHSINGYEIPRNVAFCLAGNATAAAGARNSFSAVMNRVAKIYVETDFDYWRDTYAYKHSIDPEFVSFLDNQANRHLFHGDEDTKEPWPSPRSWTECARAIEQAKSDDLINHGEYANLMMHSIVAAHVGGKASAEFMIYHNIYSQINARKIFDSSQWKLPNDPIKRFAFGAACSVEFYDRFVRKDKRALKTYCEMMNAFEKHCPEIAIRSIRYLAGKDFKIPQALTREKALSQKTLSRLLDISQTLQ